MADDAPRGRPRLSLWAAASAVCAPAALVPVCLPLAILGPIMGIIGLRQTARPEYRGRPLAVVGLGLGLFVIVWYVMAGVWWNNNARQPLIHGPTDAMMAAMIGDPQGCRDRFHGAGAAASDAEIAEWGNALSMRYGMIVGSQQSPEAPEGPEPEGNRRRVGYLLQFERATVPAEAVFVVGAPGHILPVLKWESVRVIDPDLAAVVYPPAPAPTDG